MVLSPAPHPAEGVNSCRGSGKTRAFLTPILLTLWNW